MFRHVCSLAIVCLFGSICVAEEPHFPSQIKDINGKVIDLAQIAQSKQIVVVTLKSPHCPVCQEQLKRIKNQLKKFQSCGMTFLVMTSGPVSAIKKIQESTAFPFPFFEDRGLEVAKRFQLLLEPSQILPAIILLDKDLKVSWIQRGRAPFYFGDPALLKVIKCENWI